jgi:hypothetical protein
MAKVLSRSRQILPALPTGTRDLLPQVLSVQDVPQMPTEHEPGQCDRGILRSPGYSLNGHAETMCHGS